MNTREDIAVLAAQSTIKRLQPAITARTATNPQKHEYWDALEVIRSRVAEIAREDHIDGVTAMSHTMPNPVRDFGEFFKILGSVTCGIVLCVVVVSVLAFLMRSLS